MIIVLIVINNKSNWKKYINFNLKTSNKINLKTSNKIIIDKIIQYINRHKSKQNQKISFNRREFAHFLLKVTVNLKIIVSLFIFRQIRQKTQIKCKKIKQEVCVHSLIKEIANLEIIVYITIKRNNNFKPKDVYFISKEIVDSDQIVNLNIKNDLSLLSFNHLYIFNHLYSFNKFLLLLVYDINFIQISIIRSINLQRINHFNIQIKKYINQELYHCTLMIESQQQNITGEQMAFLTEMLQRYGKSKLIQFIQCYQPLKVVQIKQYFLRDVNKRLNDLNVAAQKLIIKFRGHDGDINQRICKDKKAYIKSYIQPKLSRQLRLFPKLIKSEKILSMTNELVIYFPYLLFKHQIFSQWNQSLTRINKVTIFAQDIQSRANFDKQIKVQRKTWRSLVNWKDIDKRQMKNQKKQAKQIQRQKEKQKLQQKQRQIQNQKQNEIQNDQQEEKIQQ